jgi:hypothetical protein
VRRALMRVLAMVMPLALLGLAVPMLTAAAPVASKGVGVYEEDFTTYAYKDYVEGAEWDTDA